MYLEVNCEEINYLVSVLNYRYEQRKRAELGNFLYLVYGKTN